jgi:hypothetical protein
MAEPLSFDDLMNMSKVKPQAALQAEPTLATPTNTDKPLNLDDLNNIGKAKAIPTPDTDELAIDNGATLKKQDLFKRDNINKIRNFMIDYRGVDYKKKDDEAVVEDFVGQMRWFNTNMVSTAGMVRHVYNADDKKKATANDAFKLYDRLGNVFTNDGFYGAIDGVTDYIAAAASDPSNYIGALTGGLGKWAALGVTQSSKAAVKLAASEAGKRVLTKGATQQAAFKAADEAAEAMAKRIAHKSMTSELSKELISKAALQEQRLYLLQAEKRAAKAYGDNLVSTAAKKSVYQTFGIDGSLAAINDIQIQNAMMQLDESREFNAMQTGFSSLLGSVGAGMQIVGSSFKGASGLADVGISMEIGAERQALRNAEALALDLPTVSKVKVVLNDTLDSWKDKYTRGKTMFDPNVTPTDLLKEIMLGPDGKGGLAKVFKDNGLKLNDKMSVSDVMTNVVRQIPQAELKAINDKLAMTGIKLGEMTELGVNLGDLLAKDIRQGAQALNIMSQVRKTIDAGLVRGTEQLDAITSRTDAAKLIKEAGDPTKKAKLAQYGQNLWRRLLVSSPATTAVNVAGFSQYYVANSIADIFSGTAAFAAGIVATPFSSAKSREMFRIAGIYKNMIGQKARNLMDPFTTHDAYMDFLGQNKDVEKVLFETIAGGVERSAKRFNIPQVTTIVNGKKVTTDAKWFKRTEAIANSANTITGVRIQDSFTKSQMFMNEMDKYVRLKHNVSLMDVLKSGDIAKLDDEVMSNSLDTTMKSVFSKDYTNEAQLPMIAQAAKFVETISNVPVLGTILPFGRFMNNVVATGYQWTAGGLVEAASAVVKAEKRTITTTEAFSRSLVGLSAISLAMHYDEKSSGDGNPWNLVDVGGAKVDVTNTYPFSVFKLAGRIGNLMRNDQMVPPELLQDLGTQMAVGQLAKDAQFGNDVNSLLDMLTNQDEGARKASWDALYKVTGNFAAGTLRPLDAANKLVGYIDGTDVAKDVRQAKGVAIFTQSSTKYIDNIIELFDNKIDAITGEELRVGARAGQIQDPNPVASIFGIRVKPATTSTEKAYSLAEMKEWTASERSQMPAYDKVFNEFFAPLMEKQTDQLLRSDKYMKADLVGRRNMLKDVLSNVQKTVKEGMAASPGQTGLSALRREASGKGNKELRYKAMQFLKEKYNYEGGVMNMNYDTIKMFTDYIDSLDSYYKSK